MIAKKAPRRLTGELSRWMLEFEDGVFVGQANARERDRLWELAVKLAPEAYVCQIWSDRTHPQGWRCRARGENERQPIEWDGITLIARRTRSHDGSAGGEEPSEDMDEK